MRGRPWGAGHPRTCGKSSAITRSGSAEATPSSTGPRPSCRRWARSWTSTASARGPRIPSRIPYLQELDLLQAKPALARDLRFESLFPQPCKQRYFSWLGVAGSRTGLHNDNLENLHVPIYGSKRYLLMRPDALPERLITDKYDPGTRCARVDVAELERRIDSGEEGAGPTIYEVTLRPGDLLYTPRAWWHEVTSLETTISVNCFMMFARDVPRLVGSVTLFLLHHAGLYRRGNCVCHVERASTTAGGSP